MIKVIFKSKNLTSRFYFQNIIFLLLISRSFSKISYFFLHNFNIEKKTTKYNKTIANNTKIRVFQFDLRKC